MGSLGTYIRDIRIKAGYSPEQFAGMNQMSASLLLSMEQGRMLPSKWCLLQMAGQFSLDVHKMFSAHSTELVRKSTRPSSSVLPRTELITKELQRWREGKVTVKAFPVHSPLTDFIESIIYYESQYQPYKSVKILPDGMPQLVINLDSPSAYLIGQRDRAICLSLDNNIRQIIVRFRPYGLYPLTGIPQNHLLNTILDAAYIFGKPIRLLCQKLANCTAMDSAAHAVPQFLTGLLPLDDVQVVERQVIRFVAQHIDEPVATLTRKAGYSAKHLAQLFRLHAGLSPKLLQQIKWFTESIHAISLLPTPHLSGYNWSDHYFDQAHFTRQFIRFSGFKPTAYLQTGNTCPRMVLL